MPATPADTETAYRQRLRECARELVATWRPLTPERRLQVAVLLRPDVPVGIRQDDAARAGAGPRTPNPPPPPGVRHHPTPTEKEENPP